MQIPLDYYRILGLPTQATPEQLQQAHRDRVLQLPRREYSEIAIAARRELLDEAYTTLSDSASRQAYQVHTTRSQVRGDGNPGIPTGVGLLEVAEHQAIGALLLLQELGEYELVLQVGIPLLPKKSFHPESSGESEIVQADIALTLALAYLELGREYWQQGHYESAAESLEAGQALLLKEGLFTGVRGEIKTDLYKLRPYRVLELLALPLEHGSDRRKGIQILRDMLQERGGIDGSGDDLSGLSMDDFLRFIQQLRDYLTAEEQQMLFEGEARRPSAVATYLGIYALLARGFATRQPEFIRRAKPLLVRLAKRQDVHLEQAICALLLGQTEQASRALELSREYEAIVLIREHSQGSPDLLPGLCLYAEQWLRREVFPHFRDLVNSPATLKDYFADAQVQSYLEELPQEAAKAQDEWEVVTPLRTLGVDRPRSLTQPPEDPNAPARSSARSSGQNTLIQDQSNPGGTNPGGTNPGGTRLGNTQRRGGSNVLPAVVHRSDPPARRSESRSESRSATQLAHSRKRSFGAEGDRISRGTTRGSRSSAKLTPILLMVGGGLLALGSMVFIGMNVFNWFNAASQSGSTLPPEEGLAVRLDQPVLILPNEATTANNSPTTLPSELNDTTATELVETWLKAKTEAMGSQYNLVPLTNILTGDALLQRQQEAEAAKREGFYAEYTHTVQLESWEITPGEQPTDALSDPEVSPNPETLNPLTPNTPSPSVLVAPTATIVAIVDEDAVFYQNGERDEVSSYESKGLRVEYALEQVNQQCRIRDMNVLR